MSLNSNADGKLIAAIKAQTLANKALHEVIRSGYDKEERLGQFLHQHNSAVDKGKQYRKLAEEYDRQNYYLISRFQREIETDTRIKENNESDIARLERDTEIVYKEIDQLQKDLEDSVEKLAKLKSSSKQNIITYSPPHIISNTSSLIQRLRAEDTK